METTRRGFLYSSGAVVGAATLPAWVLEREAAEAAALDRDAVAAAALARIKALGGGYADVRINRYRTESLSAREQQIRQVQRRQSFGMGVRVLVGGAWGFASSRDVTPREAERLAAAAMEIAKANAAHQRRKTELAPAGKVAGKWNTPCRRDPFEVPLADKVQFLLRVNAAAMKVPGVSYVDSGLSFISEEKFFASSDGARIEQWLVRGFPWVEPTAVDRATGDFQQRRSLPGPQGVGWECVEDHAWNAEAEQAAHDAVEKLKAKPIEPGTYDLVLHPTHLWLTIHESVGHPTELDRALGWEADYAGTSFLKPADAGKLRYGSPIVNFVADRTQPGALATVGYDDDGVPAQRWHLVKDGVFVDWQTTRETAGLIGQNKSYGCTHADSWGSVAFPRMPNVSLEPGPKPVTTEELMADVKRGILILGNGSYSIDQQRYNFQFGGQVFWEIKDGRKAGILKDVAYQSRTTDFWGRCDGLGGAATYELSGSLNDGKGQPGQSNSVSHGCPTARFRDITVINTGRGGRS